MENGFVKLQFCQKRIFFARKNTKNRKTGKEEKKEKNRIKKGKEEKKRRIEAKAIIFSE